MTSTGRTSHSQSRISLGKITGAHGIKGLVKIAVFGGDPALIETLGPVFTGESGDTTLTITMKSSSGKFWLATVAGVSDRNGAEALKGTVLYTDRNRLPDTGDANIHYHADLIGLAVIDEQNNPIGTVIDVVNFGASDLLDIQPSSGGDSFYFPFTKQTIRSVNALGVVAVFPEGSS